MTPPDFPQPVSGPAYGRTFRGLATAMLLANLIGAVVVAAGPEVFWLRHNRKGGTA